jgi:hypothetical protein
MPKITRPSLATKCNWSGKSEIGKSRQHVIPAAAHNRAAHSMSRPSKKNNKSQQLHQLAHPQYAQADANMRLRARPSGPLNVFDPWSKLFSKYIHVRRA